MSLRSSRVPCAPRRGSFVLALTSVLCWAAACSDSDDVGPFPSQGGAQDGGEGGTDAGGTGGTQTPVEAGADGSPETAGSGGAGGTPLTPQAGAAGSPVDPVGEGGLGGFAGGPEGAGGGGVSGEGGVGGSGVAGIGEIPDVDPPASTCIGVGGVGGADLGAAGAGGADGIEWTAYNREVIGRNVIPVAINNRRQVLAQVAAGLGHATCSAYLVEAEGARPISLPGGGCVRAVDINDRGVVAGHVGSLFGGNIDFPVPFLWAEGVSSSLAGVSSGFVIAINNTNQVLLGQADGSTLLWSPSGIVPLVAEGEPLRATALNNAGQVLGTGGTPTRWLLWSSGATEDVPLSNVHAMNDVGQVVGTRDEVLGVLQGDTFTPLRLTHHHHGVHVNAINNRGTMVGYYDILAGYARSPFVYVDRSLQPLWPERDGWAEDINDEGDIVGQREEYYRRSFGPRLVSTLVRSEGVIWTTDCFSDMCCL